MTKQAAPVPMDVIYKLSAKTELMYASLRLCSDSLKLHSVLGLEAVDFIVKELVDNAYEVLEALNQLQNLSIIEGVRHEC